MQFFFATPQRLHRVHSHFFVIVRGMTEGGFLFAHSHVSSVSIEVGTGFCPIWGIWRGAGTPATSQMRCWLLPNGRIFPAVAGILCVGLAYCTCIFLRCPHVGATLAFAPLLRTHSQPAWKAAHSGDTRLTARCRRSAHPQGRSCRLFSRAENRHFRHA